MFPGKGEWLRWEFLTQFYTHQSIRAAVTTIIIDNQLIQSTWKLEAGRA